MAKKSRNTAMAVVLQTTRGTYDAPNSTTDLVTGFSNCRLSIDPLTVPDDTYTGSVFTNADAVAGKRVSVSGNLKLKPPSSLPDADAFILGRILQAAKFTEVRTATAIPSSAEAVGVSGNDTTHLALSTGATGTDDLYNGFPILNETEGAAYMDQLTLIRDYVGSTKLAEVMQTLGGAPADNYQIPPFIGYYRDTSSADPEILSVKLWVDGFRYDMYDCGITSMRLVIPTSTKQQTQFPEFEFTLDCTISATADEATPSIPATGQPPLLKDGKGFFNKIAWGIESINIDLNLQADYPPNPNQPDGTDAPEIAGGSATATMRAQKYSKAALDMIALADAQAYHPLFAQWGSGAWAAVQVAVLNGRLAYASPDLSGGIVMEGTDIYIDVLDRNLAIVFPGGAALS